MKKIGIICEYNPFHSGHAHQIETVRRAESDAAIICLMSGHATQRGALAVADKYTRAEMALSCGADIVLELPYPYSAASASYFAGAGVAILDALGADGLCFGSECADRDLLEQAAAITASPDFHAGVSARQRNGEGSASAYFEELRRSLQDNSWQLLANDILAVEYVRAIRVLQSTMQPMPIKRDGVAYGAHHLEEGRHPSATALREQLHHGNVNESLRYIPVSARDVLKKAVERQKAPVSMGRLDAAVLAFFRLHAPQEIAEIAEMQGGLAYRLCTAARESTSYAELLTKASSKSYPTARLRRAILFAMTGVREADLRTPPAYLSLLGANARGRELLRIWKGDSPISVFAKFADAANFSPAAQRQAELSMALDSLITLAQPLPCAADTWIKIPPVMK